MKMASNYILFEKRSILFWISLPILYLFSLIYNFLISVTKLAYRMNILRSYRPKLKVISVGNITVGGSGKTPLVEWLVRYFKKENKHVGIIIRGYKRPNKSYNGLVKSGSSYPEIGDEAGMFKEKFEDIKICVGKDKVNSALRLEKENCDIAIIDDGFQHWRLKRDLDIVAVDASSLLREQKLLPLGRLREPLNSLRRADILCLTKTDISKENYLKNREILSKINPKALIVSIIYEAVGFCDLKTADYVAVDSDKFLNKPVFILCGIANPLYFEKMVEKLKLRIGRKFICPDHYQYHKSDLDLIKKIALDNDVDTIITTHKDAVRLKSFLDIFENINIFSLEIKLKIIENEELFSHRLLSVLSS